MDEQVKTVSVLTTHLSDWSPLSDVQLTPLFAKVRFGQTVALKLVLSERRNIKGSALGWSDRAGHVLAAARLPFLGHS